MAPLEHTSWKELIAEAEAGHVTPTAAFFYGQTWYSSAYGPSAKASRGSWSNEDLERAMAAFKNGDMGLNKCASTYGVPKATLKRLLEGTNKFAKGHKHLGRTTILQNYLENQLHDLILHLEKMFFGLSRKDLMSLAFELAEENGLPHPFNMDKQSAGKGWYYLFLKRFPDISLRQPEATSISRSSGFNRDAISRYFSLLEAEAAWLVVVAMIWGCTNPLLKYNSKGVDRIQRNGRVSQILAEAKHLFLNWKYLLSFFANQTGSVVYYITLASADVTLAVPVTSSLTFIFTGISAWILGERNAITKETFLGLALVMSGVLLCVLSKLDTKVLEKT